MIQQKYLLCTMPTTKLTSNNCFRWYQSTAEKKKSSQVITFIKINGSFSLHPPVCHSLDHAAFDTHTHTHTHTHTEEKIANSFQCLFLWKQS